MQLDYFYGSEAEQYCFYKIPKPLFTDERFSKVSIEAKVLYSLLLDRMGLSAQKNWHDESGRTYIYFTLDQVMRILGIGKDKALKLFKELDTVGLIERKRQGLGKPTKIYVKKFISTEFDLKDHKSPKNTEQNELSQSSVFQNSGFQKNTEVLTSENPNSCCGCFRSQDFAKAEIIKTDIIKTDDIYTDHSISSFRPRESARFEKSNFGARERMEQIERYRAEIKSNIDYDNLVKRYPYDSEKVDCFVELMLEVLSSTKDSIQICGDTKPIEIVKDRFLRIGYDHIRYTIECLSRNTTSITNMKAYMLATLYNAPITISQHYESMAGHDLEAGA